MSRTLSAALSGHIARNAHSRCTMLLLELTNGSAVGATDHDKDISYNLADATSGTVSYKAGTGIIRSDVVLSSSLETDSYEVTGPISGAITLDDILGGTFNNARVWLFEINWRSPADGRIAIMPGNVRGASADGGTFRFEVRSDFDRFNQVVGRTLTNNCDADFADQVRCFAVATGVTGTVTAVTDAMTFTVSFTGSYADDFFNFGTVEFLTGNLAGTQRIEIFDWTAAGVITLFTPAAEAPAIGDTMTIRNGCMKSRAACMAHNAIQYFRGFPEIPGSDQILRAAIPGEGDQ